MSIVDEALEDAKRACGNAYTKLLSCVRSDDDPLWIALGHLSEAMGIIEKEREYDPAKRDAHTRGIENDA